MAAPRGSGQPVWVRRIGWFVAIWLVSVIVLASAAALLRALMNFAGLTA
jgi:Protein of unknown function (DUF2474)